MKPIVPVQPLIRHITLRVDVTGLRIWRARLWLGVQIIRLAALVMGTGIRFDEKES